MVDDANKVDEDRRALPARFRVSRWPLFASASEAFLCCLHEFGLALDDGRKLRKPRRHCRKSGSDKGERSLTLRKRRVIFHSVAMSRLVILDQRRDRLGACCA